MTRHPIIPSLIVLGLLAACFGGLARAAEPAPFPPHPYLLWNADDIAAMKKQVATEPWAREQAEAMKSAKEPLGAALRELYLYAVLDDREAGQRQKAQLLLLLKAARPLGGSNEFNALRYDLLYDQLTPQERTDLEKLFRDYIDYSVLTEGVFDPKLFNDAKRYSRYDTHEYGKANWLPNIIFPRKTSANLFALVLGDRELIDKAWRANGSLKYYFDEYLSDGGLYQEEFTKMAATPGAILLWCEGLRHVGLDAMGYGYTGRTGATMKGHLLSLMRLGYPRVDLGSTRPQYPRMAIGDVRGTHKQFPAYAFQHSIVTGFLPDGTGGNDIWNPAGAWGGTTRGFSEQWDLNKTEKMQVPYWFEVGHHRWPDAGFDYFLAQMRRPGQDKYIPSPYFGVEPIDPAVAAKHAPAAPSHLARERGVAMLRAEESPAYWESPAPAVALRLASPYSHDVNDPFTIAGFVAFNRPIYINRHINPSYADGWSRSIKSHAGVLVDDIEPRPAEYTARTDFRPAYKFLHEHSDKVYKGADVARYFMLTGEYLVDVSRLSSDQARRYQFRVHALGQAQTSWQPAGNAGLEPELENVRGLAGDADWSAMVIQGCPKADATTTRLGKAWYDRRIGVKLWMPGGAGTLALLADTPRARTLEGKVAEGDETGGTTIVARRTAKATTFVAVHEPVAGGESRLTSVSALAQSDDALAIAVVGPAINDRVLISFSDAPVTIDRPGLRITFTGQAMLRITPRQVEATGDIQSLRMKVDGAPALLVNGVAATAKVSDGVIEFSKSPK